jgi:hypothetical protein
MMDKVKAEDLKKYWRRAQRLLKQFLCSHTHTFSHSLGGLTHWYNIDDPVSRRAKPKGEHNHLVLCGCYRCGLTWIEDWGA